MAATDIYISAQAHPSVKEYLERLAKPWGGILREVAATHKTYPAAAAHPDLYFCALGGRILSGAPAGPAYPENIGFNGVQLGGFFVHNLKYTCDSVLAQVRQLGLTEINVKQGYTNCSLVIVDDGLCGPAFQPLRRPAVITSDRGIVRSLSPYPIDVLTVQPGHVLLPGLPFGFLGGASGRVGRQIIFHGDLSAHPDFLQICSFCRQRNREPLWFPDFALTDIGSIITLL